MKSSSILKTMKPQARSDRRMRYLMLQCLGRTGPSQQLKASTGLTIICAIVVSVGVAHGQRGPIGQAYALTHAANYDPALSPDGKQMVYISVLMGREQFFVMNIDGTHS